MIAPIVFPRVLASWCLATGQGAAEWTVRPPRPTVGDTVRIERIVGAPVGWRVRGGRLDATDRVEPLADPTVERVADGWRVRYTVVAWAPGAHTLALPPLWLLGPGGQADSLAGGTARFQLVSVLPDTTPEPKPATAPLRAGRPTAVPVALALLVSGAWLVVGVRWRRRPPRAVAAPPRAPGEPDVPDSRWLAAGERRAVAARATAGLRRALARAVPEAHEALSTAECLEVVARARPGAPIRELRETLQALNEEEFAAVHGGDPAALAARARALAREVAP